MHLTAGIGVGVDNLSNWRGIRINIQHKINIKKGCSLKGIHAWLGHGAIVQIICIGEIVIRLQIIQIIQGIYSMQGRSGVFVYGVTLL